MNPDMEKMKEYQEVIKKILGAFDRISFPVIVESAIGFKVEPINRNDEMDKSLVKEISTIADIAANKYNKTEITREVYRLVKGNVPKAFRPNEVGVILENEFSNAFSQNKTKFKFLAEVNSLKQVGYPDTEVKDKENRFTYIDIKATTRPDVGSPRDFYFTPLENTKKKIRSDGRHLVLGFITREVGPEKFKTVGWKLVDLSKINVSMKPEFNADNLEIYKKEAIVAEKII